MKLFEFTINNDNYTISGDLTNFKLMPTPSGYVEDIIIKKNGSVITDFGQRWNGSDITAFEVFSTALAVYFNDETSLFMKYVLPEIESFKNKYQDFHVVDIDGEEYRVHKKFLTMDLDIADLEIISKTNAYYFGFDEAICVSLKDRKMLSNIEAFVFSAVVDEIKEAAVVYITEECRENFRSYLDKEKDSIFVIDFLDRELEDDETETGGVAYLGETLRDFLLEADCFGRTEEEWKTVPLYVVNEALVGCGIKPISLF